MSFVLHRPGMLAKNLWDEKLVAALKTDSLANKKRVEPVPITYEDVCEWATIASKSVIIDRTRPVDVLYKRPVTTMTETVYPVTLRLQGFLGKHDLSLFGTWDGSKSGAPSAIQQLTLHSGGHPELWSHYLDAVKHIRTLIHSILGGRESTNSGTEYELRAQRRVFTKVNNYTRNQPSVVTLVEDPAGRTTSLLPDWKIVDRLEIGRWTGEKAIACSPAVLREGDFVDVGVSFDIFVLPRRRKSVFEDDRRLVRAHMNIEHVLQLCSAEDAREFVIKPVFFPPGGKQSTVGYSKTSLTF